MKKSLAEQVLENLNESFYSLKHFKSVVGNKPAAQQLLDDEYKHPRDLIWALSNASDPSHVTFYVGADAVKEASKLSKSPKALFTGGGPTSKTYWHDESANAGIITKPSKRYDVNQVLAVFTTTMTKADAEQKKINDRKSMETHNLTKELKRVEYLSLQEVIDLVKSIVKS